MAALKIGEVSKRSGFSVEAIRYYERLGLIPDASRTAAGHRQFEPHVVPRLRFVRRAQALGFTLEEIRELLELRAEPGGPAAAVRGRAEAKLSAIEAKIADLEAMRDALRTIVRACRRQRTTGDCPILEALDGRDGRED
jgi:DNA-binding transcriptional MerR regulator